MINAELLNMLFTTYLFDKIKYKYYLLIMTSENRCKIKSKDVECS